MQYRIKGHFCSWGEQWRLQERFDTENGGQSIKVCLTIAPAGASRPYVPDGESAAASLRPVGAETADVTQAPAPPQVYCSRLRFDDWVRYNIENNSSFYEMPGTKCRDRPQGNRQALQSGRLQGGWKQESRDGTWWAARRNPVMALGGLLPCRVEQSYIEG